MTMLPTDLFPFILCLLSTSQLGVCSLVNSQMQHMSQALLFSHYDFRNITGRWATQREFFLSSRGQMLAKHIRSLAIHLYIFDSQSLDDLSELLSLVHSITRLEIDAGYTGRCQTWSDVVPGLWDALFSKVGEDVQSLTVNRVRGVPLEYVLVRCPSLRHLQFWPIDSGYMNIEKWTTPPCTRSHFRSLTISSFTGLHPGLESFLQQTRHGLQELHRLSYHQHEPSPFFQLVHSLRETLVHLSFDSHLFATVSRARDPDLLPLSALTRLQTLTFYAWLPGIGPLPSWKPGTTKAATPPCGTKDDSYPFHIWIARLITEEGLPLSFTTFRFLILIHSKPYEFLRHEELDSLAASTRAGVKLSFELNCEGSHFGHTSAVRVVEQYLPTWKELGKLRIRLVEGYKYDASQTHWEPLSEDLPPRLGQEDMQVEQLDEPVVNFRPESQSKLTVGNLKRFFCF
ncbi:hypothetical protein DL96DRAFT_1706437 [Flagelloscypha sp. PMI_526]|nr:hypothetical protein DL96DRAFT_1706437 [Flagelloscypha sp. PMI_526]